MESVFFWKPPIVVRRHRVDSSYGLVQTRTTERTDGQAHLRGLFFRAPVHQWKQAKKEGKVLVSSCLFAGSEFPFSPLVVPSGLWRVEFGEMRWGR